MSNFIHFVNLDGIIRVSLHLFLTFYTFIVNKFQYLIFQLLYNIKLSYTLCASFVEKNVKTLKSKYYMFCLTVYKNFIFIRIQMKASFILRRMQEELSVTRHYCQGAHLRNLQNSEGIYTYTYNSEITFISKLNKIRNYYRIFLSNCSTRQRSLLENKVHEPLPITPIVTSSIEH